MPLNWKEINVILSELNLAGCQIQKINQSGFDVLSLRVYGKQGEHNLLAVIRSGVCRLHETFRDIPKNDKPLRFGELLKSRVINGWIEEASQIGSDRIVRLTIRRGEFRYYLYFRLWSNAANVLLCDMDGKIIDAMRRLPKRGEIGGAYYKPELTAAALDGTPCGGRYSVRELEGEGSFNEKIDRWYAEQGEALSLETLRAEATRRFEGGISRLEAALARLREKEADYADAARLKEYGGIIMANLPLFDDVERSEPDWIEAEDFPSGGGLIRIKVDPKKSGVENAAVYYERYRKAKSGLADVRAEIVTAESKIIHEKEQLERLLSETNPLRLQKLIIGCAGAGQSGAKKDTRKRPGLSFRRGDWLLIVGRDAKENDELLRRHVKGNDLWLHARDFAGSYVFIKQRSGKTVPLQILLDAANLALFYSKGRGAGKGELFYTHVKYLRRAKNGPKGLVLPTQEKNLSVTLESRRLKELENCRVSN
ncbi:MAG: NFACT family protein [Spirochaetaceae bacterium]|jgi:predicted ribosome quality control (RQC) complex YloA/Tae2 family protein|nr:NFACT family protein [Spirochaetaceae bacterium]